MVAAAAQDDDTRIFGGDAIDDNILASYVAYRTLTDAAVDEFREAAKGILTAMANGNRWFALNFDNLSDQPKGVLTGTLPRAAVEHIPPQHDRLANAQMVDFFWHFSAGKQRQVGAVPAGE